MYKFRRKKNPPKVKNVERKNIESSINAASTHAIHIKVKGMNATAYYSRSVGERIN